MSIYVKIVMLILVVGANFALGVTIATENGDVEIILSDSALISFENIQGERLLIRVLEGVGVHVSGTNFDPIRKDLTKDEFEGLISTLYEGCAESQGTYVVDDYNTQVYLWVEMGDKRTRVFIRQRSLHRTPEIKQIFRLIERMEQILEIDDSRLVEVADGLLRRGGVLETR